MSGKLGKLDFSFRHWSYERLFHAWSAPVATWIFQDIERLSDHESRQAARIAQRLLDVGAEVHNHPAYCLERYGLQRALHAAGINSFETIRADERRMPQVWPVFIRPASDHREPDGTLLTDQAELEAALRDWQSQGFALRSLLIIQYRGAPGSDGLWRKYATYRVGDQLIPQHMVRQNSWVAKYGKFEMPTAAHFRALRQEEQDFVRDIDGAENLKPAFDAGHITFGRADYGVVDGRNEIYEINTNPAIGDFQGVAESFPELPRQPIIASANQRILRALSALSIPKSGTIPLRDINFRRSIPLFPKRRC